MREFCQVVSVIREHIAFLRFLLVKSLPGFCRELRIEVALLHTESWSKTNERSA